MGMVVNGIWTPDADNTFVDGAFIRKDSAFAEAIPPERIERIQAGAGDHILIASMSCPWSHRAMLVRAIKGLESLVSLHIAGGPRDEGYGILSEGPLRLDGKIPRHVHQLYTRTDLTYTGRVTVPILWDASANRIVSNDSARMMRALDGIAGPGFKLVPDHLTDDIDALNANIHSSLSNAVYRAGLAQSQAAYDTAVDRVFKTLAELDQRLTHSRFLFGQVLTEADLRLFATLVRFDAVYATHFRCTRHRLVDYANLWAYARDLYQWPGVSQTVDFQTILEGYFCNDGDHNPHGIISERPHADWTLPSHRDCLGAAHLWRPIGGAGHARASTGQ